MKLRILFATALIATGVFGAAMLSPDIAAANNTPGDYANQGVDAIGGDSETRSVGDIVTAVVNVLLFVIGAIAVIMIIIGGIKYTLSQGDSSGVTSAKNTILYAVIGLIVAIVAYAIVNFVIDRFAA